MPRIVIFTDLDGTLLHPKSYSFDAALPALELIKEKKIPLVLCSSKTKAEIEVYRKRLNNKHPFISENGGGIFMPDGYFSFTILHQESPSPQPSPTHIIPPPLTGGGKGEGEKYTAITLGKPYSEIRKAFIEIRKRLKIKAKGFGDMLTEEIAELAGLPLFEAMLSKARDFDEPFVFEKGENRIEEFLDAIKKAGFHWTQGRFYHIMGENDKGKAVKILKGFLEKKHGKITTIGLGDRFNDLPLLKEVDYPVVVKNEDSTYDERINPPNLIKAEGIGPEGWNRKILRLVNEIASLRSQ
ncbi:MAG: HAD-IIB family hydrolase [Nitrospirota bacterium]